MPKINAIDTYNDMNDEPFTEQTQAMITIADALFELSFQIRNLGTAGVGDMGAIELLAKETRDGLSGIADALSSHPQISGRPE